jgi:hypothetical protein
MVNQITIACAAALVPLALAGAATPPPLQSRFLVNDRTNDRVVMLADLSMDGVIDESEVWTFFDGTNEAGTLGPANPSALGVSPLGWVVMGDQSHRAIYVLRDLNGDATAQGMGESIVFADMKNESGHSVAFPTGVAFDSEGRIHVSNAGNAFGPDIVYRMEDLNGDGTAMGAGEITVYVGEGAFGPGNGPWVPYQIVFDENDVLYLRNTGSAGLGLLGIWRFEDINGNGRADDDGEWWSFFGQNNESGLTLGPGFALDLDRARKECVYMLQTLSGPTYQLIRACDLDGDQTANGEDEAQIVWQSTASGFSPIDLVSLANGDVLISDTSAAGGANREIIRLRDVNGDGLFDTVEVFFPNEDDTVGSVRELKAVPRFADLNGDGTVDVLDLLALLDAWGACPNPYGACAGDLNGDGAVDVLDLLLLLDHWG